MARLCLRFIAMSDLATFPRAIGISGLKTFRASNHHLIKRHGNPGGKLSSEIVSLGKLQKFFMGLRWMFSRSKHCMWLSGGRKYVLGRSCVDIVESNAVVGRPSIVVRARATINLLSMTCLLQCITTLSFIIIFCVPPTAAAALFAEAAICIRVCIREIIGAQTSVRTTAFASIAMACVTIDLNLAVRPLESCFGPVSQC